MIVSWLNSDHMMGSVKLMLEIPLKALKKFPLTFSLYLGPTGKWLEDTMSKYFFFMLRIRTLLSSSFFMGGKAFHLVFMSSICSAL